jgi:hypothetical protein
MEWIITAALAVGGLVLLAFFVLRTKRHDGGFIPGRFDFDGNKHNELSKRGLFDKTKWR